MMGIIIIEFVAEISEKTSYIFSIIKHMSKYFYPSKNFGKGHRVQKDGWMGVLIVFRIQVRETNWHPCKDGEFIKQYKASLWNWRGKKDTLTLRKVEMKT